MKRIKIEKISKTKKLILLCSLLIFLSLITFAFSKYEQKKEDIQNSDEVILKIDTDSVTSITWKYEKEEFAFHKEDDNWIYDYDDAFSVDKEKIEELLSNFESVTSSFIIKNVDNYNQYGLDDPTCTINLKTDEKEYEIKVGDLSKMDSERYVDIGDGNVYLVTSDPTTYLSTSLSDFILNDEIPDINNIENIEFEGKYNYTITYTKNSKNTYSKDDVYFIEEDNKTIPLDSSKVENYISAINSINLDEYVTYNVTKKELESYGLNDPQLTIKINYKYKDSNKKEQQKSITLNIGYNKSEQKANKDDSSNVTKYIRVGNSKIVYKLDNSIYETLIDTSKSDLRHENVVWMDINDITKVEIKLEDKTHTFTTKINKNDTVRTWYYEKEKVNIADFENALKSLKVTEFTKDTTNKKEEISLKLYLNNDNYSSIDVKIYRYDGSKCIVTLDGESYAYVSRTNVMNLIEAVQAIILD